MYVGKQISTSLLKCENLNFAVLYVLIMEYYLEDEFMDSNLLQCDILVAVLLLVPVA